MATNESIRSPLPTQPSGRSPKLRIYESLFLLNEGVDHVIALLRGMENLPLIAKESLQSADSGRGNRQLFPNPIPEEYAVIQAHPERRR